jgi:hypothetical protein
VKMTLAVFRQSGAGWLVSVAAIPLIDINANKIVHPSILTLLDALFFASSNVSTPPLGSTAPEASCSSRQPECQVPSLQRGARNGDSRSKNVQDSACSRHAMQSQPADRQKSRGHIWSRTSENVTRTPPSGTKLSFRRNTKVAWNKKGRAHRNGAGAYSLGLVPKRCRRGGRGRGCGRARPRPQPEWGRRQPEGCTIKRREYRIR